MGELHLEIIISRMLREFKTSVRVGKPQVVYRETIEEAGEGAAVFDKEVAGQRHFGGVQLQINPLPRGSGNKFVTHLQHQEIPESFIPAVEAGVMESLESGVQMGYPVVDVEVVLMGGSFKESVGSELAFKVSASMACKSALSNGNPFLLDPIMKVEAFVPEAFMGDVIGDLNARGGKIESIAAKTGLQVIKAVVPLAQMFGYSTSLRSATQGRGTFSMQFSHFDRSE
jgi:elongation factor G